MKLLTIAIPAFNGAKYLKKHFHRCYLENDNLEYLIVDDGSIDDTLEVAKSLAQKYKNINVVHQNNSGFGGAIETAIINSKSKYLYFLDCDDYIDINVLEYDIKTILNLEDQNIDVFINNFVYENQDGKIKNDGINRYLLARKIITIEDFKKFKLSEFLMLHNFIIKTDILKSDLSLPHHCNYCDTIITTYLYMYANKYYFIDKVLCYYQIGRQTQSVSINNVAMNYEHYLIVAEILMKMINKEKYLSLKSNKQRKAILHNIFLTFVLAIFATFIDYKKERKSKYKEYLKRIKLSNPYIYRKITKQTPFIFSYLIYKPLLGYVFRIGKRIIFRDVAWNIDKNVT